MKRRLTIILSAAIAGCLLISQGAGMLRPEATGTIYASEPSSAPEQETAAEETGAAEAPPVDEAADGTDTETAEEAEPAGEQPDGQSPASAIGDEEVLASMDLAADNEFLELYVHPETTEIAVRDKRSQAVWYSNPPSREDDAVATGYNKSKLNVQFEIAYFDKAGNSLKYDSYTHSVQNGQFAVEKTDGGVKIVYTLGEVQSDIDAIPKYISEERFQTLILDKIPDETERREVERRFRHDEENGRYERRDSSLKGVGLKKVTGIFEAIGYDEEQIAIDKAAYGEDAGGGSNVQIPLQYRLDGQYLTVEIAAGEIEYPDMMKLQTISLLPFFGASGTSDEGYTFVPDGSGSLIHFNNGKTYAAPYRTSVYGSDLAISQLMKIQKEETARLPVFGMKYEDRGFVAIIEKGDAVASIEADISGRLNEYNTVYSSYAIHNLEEVTLTNGWRSSTVKKFQSEPFQGDISVRYGFLAEEEASYSGMAARYRDYLIETTGLTRLADETGVPFYVELIGGIPKKKFFLGIPYNSYEPLTTFEQAEAMLGQMRDMGIGNIQLRYTGWFNGGVNHDLPKSVSVDKKLGGAKGLNGLKAYASENGIGLYTDASFLEVAPQADGFKRSKQASRLITGKLAQIYPYRASDFRQEDEAAPGYVLSPKALPGVVDGFLKDYNKLQLSGLSLRDLADKLNSDFNRENVIDREEAKAIAVEQLKRMNEAAGDMLVEGGNAYAIPYARHIVEAPMESSGFNITDETVPFFQLVFHGYVQYAGGAWNMASDQDATHNFLKALETGSGLNYTWFYADSSAIKMTDFDDLYSADYRRWIDEASQRYGELNDVLGGVQSQTIKEHRKLAEGVYQTTYEQGLTIIVNYNDAPASVNGVTVGAKDYWAGGEERP